MGLCKDSSSEKLPKKRKNEGKKIIARFECRNEERSNRFSLMNERGDNVQHVRISARNIRTHLHGCGAIKERECNRNIE